MIHHANRNVTRADGLDDWPATPDARYYTQTQIDDAGYYDDEAISHVPLYNAMPDGGRFAGTSQNTIELTVGSFATTTFFNPYNGAATWTSGGQFIHNNTDFGGSGGSMTQDVLDLLEAMDRNGNDGRYGAEFFIGQSTSGSGTAAASYGGRRLFSQNNPARTTFGVSNYSTWMYWLRAKSGDDITLRNFESTYLDGVLQVGGSYTIGMGNTSDEWVHVIQYVSSGQGQQTAAPGIYCTPGTPTVVQIACPVVVPGKISPGVRHVAPVMTFNGNNA